MYGLTPQFILERFAEGEESGSFRCPALFLDLSGFTTLTSALMERGDEGAELLSEIINKLFDPLLSEVSNSGGVVTTFAGDAFTALFPDGDVNQAALCALALQRVKDEHHVQRTPAGEFGIEARVGIGYGTVEWGIVRGRRRATYYFRGTAVADAVAAEGAAQNGEVMLGSAAGEHAGGTLRVSRTSDGFARVDAGEGTSAVEGQPSGRNASGERYENLQSHFVPVDRFPTRSGGEFRTTASVFLMLGDSDNHEAVVDMIRPILDTAEEYGGYTSLLDFGDKGPIMLVLFGAPAALGDDTTRAAEFAVNVVEAESGVMSAGITNGTAFAGFVGGANRRTYTALGSVVNLSARLAGAAERGTVVTAGRVVDELRRSYVVNSLGKRALKGFSKEIELFTLARSGEVSGAEPPFVGREREIERLREVAGRMLGSRECSHYVLGEAGAGKSRLVQTVVDGLGETANSITLETDTILRKSMNSLPVLIRRAFRIAGIDPDETESAAALSQLTEWLSENGVEEHWISELTEAGSGLLSLLGPVAQDSLYAQLDPEARFELILRALVALIAALSQVKPLLLIADNAHGLDAETRAVYTRLVSGVPGRRFAVFFVGRGSPSDSPFDIEEDVGDERITMLGGLTPEEISRLASELIQGPVSGSLVDFIIHRVGTNPLYVGELTRYLVQHQLLTRGEDGYEVSQTEVSLPSEVSGLLVARVDSLPRQLKESAQAAAVLGAEFDPVVLQELMNVAGAFDHVLRQGEENGLWRRTEEGTYRFTQELIRSALEDMQLSSTRRTLHARSARLLNQLYSDNESINADLAYHYLRADMTEQAQTALRRAADHAIENFKNEKALEFLDTFQQQSPSFEDRIEAYRDMASIYELTGRWRTAADTLTYALGLSVITRDLETRARLLATLGEIYRKQSETTTAISILEQARRIAREKQQTSLYAEALIYLGRSYWARGEYENALAHLDDALENAKRDDNLELEALALYYQGTVYRDQSRFGEADDNFQRSYRLLDQLGNDRLSTYPLYDLGVVRLQQGKLEEAQEYFSRVLTTYNQIGYQSGASAATLNLGVLRDRRGDFKGALRYYEQAREIAENIQEEMAIGYTLFSIGATHYKIGDDRKSMAYLKDSLKLLQKLEAKGYYGYPLSYLVSLLARAGHVDKAIQTAYQHHTVVRQVGTDPENGRALMGIARAIAKSSELKPSSKEQLQHIAGAHGLSEVTPEAFFERAIEISQPTAYVDTLIPAHSHYAEYLRSRGDDEGFRRHLKTAFETAVEAKWDRFVKQTRKRYRDVLKEMGVDTEVATESIEGVEA